MKIYKNTVFARFARGQNISDADLCEAVERANRGLVDADPGGGVIKQRIARPGEGRSGGFRTIVLFRIAERAFFVFGFAKNQQDNIGKKDLKDLKDLAKKVLAYTEEDLESGVQTQNFTEVICDEEDLQE